MTTKTHELILRTLPVVERISRKRARGNPEQYDEYYSWGCCKLTKIAAKCTNEKTFPRYAAMVIDGGILDYIRQTAKHPTVSFDDELVSSNHPHSIFWDEITQGLAPRWREALVLYYQENRTLEEVGAALGLGRTQVGKILKEVREYIKDRWNEEDLHDLCAD